MTSHITTSGGLITVAFIENIRRAGLPPARDRVRVLRAAHCLITFCMVQLNLEVKYRI
jgi:hypothetical protein